VTDTEPLLLTRDGTVATLTINRPRRLNALTYAMFSQLPKLLEEAAAMPGLRALVVRGAGTRAFSAGADISEFETTRMTREQAAACVSIAKRAGLDFLVLDQTRPDIEAPVVRVIVPGLRHFYRRFARGRLYDVPVELGLRDRPLEEHELNPIHPHT